MGKSR
ncbi:hypothetical protein D039_4062A, partial [Vibrio parahaemolyticus EKP-028]